MTAPRNPARQGAAPRRAGGFTLIELLVALTLFGLMSVVVMGGLRFGTRVWETGETRAQAAAEVEAVQGILRRYLAQAIIPLPSRQRIDETQFFIGDTDRLRFVTITPAHVGVGGLYQVEIARREGAAGEDDTLEMAWHLFRPDDPRAIEYALEVEREEETLAAGRRTLLTGVKAVAFGYYLSEGPGFADAEWEESWDESDALPGLIALNVEFAEGAGRSWPILVVQTRLARAGR